MGQKDFEQGLIVGMQVGGGDKSEAKRQAIIQDLLFINVPVKLTATWAEIDAIINSLSDLLYPRLLSCETDITGNQLIMAFNRAMINPSGKQAEFNLKVDDVAKNIQSISLDPTNNHRYLSTLAEKVNYGLALKLAYTKGSVLSDDNATLQNIVDFVITNNVSGVVTLLSAETSTDGTKVILKFDTLMSSPSGKQSEFGIKTESVGTSLYQQWTNYSQTPTLTSERSYQFLATYNDNTYLFITTSKFYHNSTDNLIYNVSSATIKQYVYQPSTKEWAYSQDRTSVSSAYILTQANNNIYTDSTITTVYFAKTTSDTVTTQLSISSSELDTSDNKNIILTINTETEYQKWEGYPDSHTNVKLMDYPYQAIIGRTDASLTFLIFSDKPFNHVGDNGVLKQISSLNSDNTVKSFGAKQLDNGVWQDITSYQTMMYTTGIIQSNANVYEGNLYNQTTIYFAKTTPTTSPKITNSQTVKTSYTKGTVTGANGAVLESYIDEVVENNVISDYQDWANYPDSPVLLSDYPYQMVYKEYSNGIIKLKVSKTKFYYGNDGGSYDYINIKSPYNNRRYTLNGSTWTNLEQLNDSGLYVFKDNLYESNTDIYTDATLTTVWKAKTT